MKITISPDPKAPPPPRQFVLELDEDEFKYLLCALGSIAPNVMVANLIKWHNLDKEEARRINSRGDPMYDALHPLGGASNDTRRVL